tara:strand:- start:251 stop:448 length:198 start_codon:yes stop_codon:yes gene_type:complete
VFLVFNPFGDNLQSERTPHGNNGFYDGLIIHVFMQVAHKRLVDLDLIQREPFEVLQRRVASAEIV